MTYLIRFIKFIGIVLLFLAGAVLVDINRAGMAFVEGWYPGYGAWAFGALATLEFLCLFGLWRSVFGRKSHLVLRLDADAEQTAAATLPPAIDVKAIADCTVAGRMHK